jgi:dGTP triphosphohydrolase
MFTVVICNRAVVDDCKSKYAIYLKPFLEKSGYAFCRWDPKGATLAEAVPDLYELTAEYSVEEMVKDHVAGMTDRFAINLYNDLFMPKGW